MLDVTGGNLEARRSLTRALRGAILADPPTGVLDVVGGLESVLVRFDCARVRHEQIDHALARLVREVVAAKQDLPSGRDFVVPTVFGGDYGPDLDSVADELAMTSGELIRAVTDATLIVDVLGSGIAPMMHGASLPGSVARCQNPRAHVPAGAVMVADRNTIIGPAPGPSGWRILGQTPLDLIDIHREPVAHYAPGDRFRFTAITEREWCHWAGHPLEPIESGMPR